MLSHQELKTHALAQTDVKAEYDKLEAEFALIDMLLEARKAASPSPTPYSSLQPHDNKRS